MRRLTVCSLLQRGANMQVTRVQLHLTNEDVVRVRRHHSRSVLVDSQVGPDPALDRLLSYYARIERRSVKPYEVALPITQEAGK
jgi:hypothetical protein